MVQSRLVLSVYIEIKIGIMEASVLISETVQVKVCFLAFYLHKTPILCCFIPLMNLLKCTVFSSYFSKVLIENNCFSPQLLVVPHCRRQILAGKHLVFCFKLLTQLTSFLKIRNHIKDKTI